MKQRWTCLFFWLALLAFPLEVARAGAGLDYVINSEKSKLEVSVFKEGVFKAFGHNHLISATRISGRVLFNEKALRDSSVELIIPADSLSVVDPGESETDRRRVQSTMAGEEVLHSDKYPEIRFNSTRIVDSKKIDDGWDITLEGRLALHGFEQPISLPLHLRAKEGELHAEGEASLLQTDFGITPIKIGGGAVKVKNKVRIRFDVVARALGPQ